MSCYYCKILYSVRCTRLDSGVRCQREDFPLLIILSLKIQKIITVVHATQEVAEIKPEKAKTTSHQKFVKILLI